jgi:hypothetical protein
MKAQDNWRRHLRDLVNAGLDPLVYAVQWAQDPRCLQSGTGHRRVGFYAAANNTVCRLWAGKLPSNWT